DLLGDVGREVGLAHDLVRLGGVDPDGRVDGLLDDLLRLAVRDLFDLHTAGGAGDAEERAVGTVEQVGEVVLLDDLGRRGHHHLVDGVALDVHPQDVGGPGLRLVHTIGELHAAGLATPADLHLGLDDHLAAQPLGDGPGLLRGRRDAAV